MRTFEIFTESKKKGHNGRRKFKVILHKIHPDACIDEINEVGTEYNLNGITWIREYCEAALPTIKGMSLRCEFLDDERTELSGHGMTDIKDGVPIFENAVVIGTFEDGYIDDVTDDEGNTFTACIGVGEIDSSCYNNLCHKLDEDIENGIYPSGSVEIMRTEDNDVIVYKYGYKEKSRIPTEFAYSGYALLGVTPSDQNAKLVELNETQKEDIDTMNDSEIKVIVEQTVAMLNDHASELNECKDSYEQQIAELNAAVEAITAEKNEAIANSEKIQSALDECRDEMQKKYEEIEGLYAEMSTLREELGKAKAKERIGELNSAIAEFSDEEKAYAQAEIDAFNAEPITSEINSVVSKIYEGIGKKTKETAVVSEINEAHEEVNIEDIFSAVDTVPVDTDTNIF